MFNLRFKDFFEEQLIIETGYTELPQHLRLKHAHEVDEPFIRDQLAKHGINIVPSDLAADMQGVDGYWDGNQGQTVQIKTRLSDRDDIRLELLQTHDMMKPFEPQLKTGIIGRDWKMKPVHYFILNSAKTKIYHVFGAKLHKAVNDVIEALNNSPHQGMLRKPFRSNIRGWEVTLREVGPKVMAYVPIEMVASRAFDVQQ
jgi:hypothetical protein